MRHRYTRLRESAMSWFRVRRLFVSSSSSSPSSILLFLLISAVLLSSLRWPLVPGVKGEEIGTEAETTSSKFDERQIRNDAAIRRVLSEEGYQEYKALIHKGYVLRSEGKYEESGKVFRQAMNLYTGALAAPYIRFSTYTNYGKDLMYKYARPETEPGEHRSFREVEMDRTKEVQDALSKFVQTLAKPHVT